MSRIFYLSVVLFITLTIFAYSQEGLSESKVYYCVQLGSFSKKETAMELFNQVKYLPHARMEKIGGFYIIRVGLGEKEIDVYSLYKRLKTKFRDAWLRRCYYVPSRIVVSIKKTEVKKSEKKIEMQKEKKKVYYCVQLGSFSERREAVDLFKKLEYLPYARVEKIGQFYTIRIGLEEKKINVLPLYKRLKKEFKDAWLHICYYIPSRIIMPVKVGKKAIAKPAKVLPKQLKKRPKKIEGGVKGVKLAKQRQPLKKEKRKRLVKAKIPVQKHLIRRIRPSPKAPLGVIPKRKVILFPIENISAVSHIPERKILNYWAHFFKERDFQIVFPEDIEEFLFANRIRKFHYISTSTAQELGQRFGAEAVVLSWVDLYNPSVPEIGFGIKVINTQTGDIIWINYVTLRGDDFRSWFGLGEIKDIERLMQIAVKQLFHKFPSILLAQKREIPVGKSSVPILEKFSLEPKVVRGGDLVKISLRLLAPDEMCSNVAVLIGEKEVFLKNSSPDWEGSAKAPKEEGFYFTKVKIWDRRGLINFINTGMILTVDNTPPKLKISYENPVFSPNKDEVKDCVIFFPFLLEPERIEKWNFYIYDEDGNIVRNLEGSGDLPKGWAWHGEDDHFNGVKDGVYFFQCVIRDIAGNITRTDPIKIIIDRAPPQINVSFITEQNKVICRILSKDGSGIRNWFFSILDRRNNIYKLFEGEDTPPDKLVVKLAGPLKDYYFMAEVEDGAGNITKFKLPLIGAKGVAKEKSTKKKEKKSVEWNYDF